MNVWRIHLNPEPEPGHDPFQFCTRERGIVGVGYSIGRNSGVVSWEEYERLARVRYADRISSDWWPALNAIRNRINIGDFIWTRNDNRNYFLGRITGDWRYDDSEDYANADIVNFRECKWREIEDNRIIPLGVVNSFPGKIVQRIRRNANAIAVQSQEIYLTGR